MARKAKSKNLLLFTGLVILVVAYAIFDFQSEKKTEQKKQEQAKVFAVSKDHIGSFVLQNGSGEISMQKKNDGWWMETPKQELGDQGAVDSFLTFLVDEKSSEAVSEGEINWTLYGLDQPLGKVTVKDNAGKEFSVAVGKKKNFEGQSYLRKNQDNKVLVGAEAWNNQIEKKAFDFRDKRVLRFPGVQTQKISYNSKRSRFDLILQDDQWVSPQLKGKKLDQNKVREIITLLQGLEALEFLSEGPPQKDQVKALGLNEPMVTLTLYRKEGTPWTAKVFGSPHKVFSILTSEPVLLSKIAPTHADALSGYEIDKLRDRSEPFDFNKNDVRKIDFKTPLKTGILAKAEQVGKKEKWTLSGQENENVDSDAVETFLSNLRNLQVSQFRGSGSLKKIERTIRLFSSEESLLYEIMVGGLVKDKGLSYYEVKTSKNAEVLWLKEADVNNLNLQNVFVAPQPDPAVKKDEK